MSSDSTIAMTSASGDDPDTTAPGDLRVGTTATLQHISMLHARAQKLNELRIEGETQFLHRVGVAYESGRLSLVELAQIHREYQRLDLPSKSTRWNSMVPVPWARMQRAYEWLPNGPAGTWAGRWPLDNASTSPFPGLSVVYVLFDGRNEPVYVGSSGNFRERLKRHMKDGKNFIFWQAYPASNREAAYELEVKLLREHLPKLNKKVGR